MKRVFAMTAMLGLFASAHCFAAAPADAPAGATGLCKDGSYYTGAEKKGACRGHKGVKDWYESAPAAKSDSKAEMPKAAPGPSPAAAAKSPATMPAATASTPKAMPAPTATASAPKAMPTPAATAAPGGGTGKVWANASTKVYHCEGDRWYGKTKNGEYLTEADAKAKGFKPDHGKACQ